MERTLRPTKSVVSVASVELDVLPPSDADLAADPGTLGRQIHQMVLLYPFDLAPGEKSDATQKVVPRVQVQRRQKKNGGGASATHRLCGPCPFVFCFFAFLFSPRIITVIGEA